MWHLSSAWKLRDAKRMLDEAASYSIMSTQFEGAPSSPVWAGYELRHQRIEENLERAWQLLAPKLDVRDQDDQQVEEASPVNVGEDQQDVEAEASQQQVEQPVQDTEVEQPVQDTGAEQQQAQVLRPSLERPPTPPAALEASSLF